MSYRPDISIVDIHRLPDAPCTVDEIEGSAWRVLRPGQFESLAQGDAVEAGDTLALSPEARLRIGTIRLVGGHNGRAHALVGQEAFAPSDTREDVVRLVADLDHLEREMGGLGEDPFLAPSGPTSEFDQAMAAEFARLNFDYVLARSLPKTQAHTLRAVCLFLSEQTAFVALDKLTLPKLRTLIETLGRPVNPHLVTSEVLDELLARAYVDLPS